MTTNDEVRHPTRPAGGDSLARYKAHGGGMELFRAYVERRNADKQLNANHKAEVIATITPEEGRGVPVDVFECAVSKLTMIQILEELDPIIQELLRFCENQPLGKEQLSELRLLLQIDDGRAPDDTRQTQRRWEIEQLWVAAYLRMEADGQFKSENKLSEEIAANLPDSLKINGKAIGPRQVLNHWKDKKEREPWQALWAKQIEDRASYRAKLEKKRANEAKAAKKATSTRPKKSDYRKHHL